jgi:hypothetical protein
MKHTVRVTRAEGMEYRLQDPLTAGRVVVRPAGQGALTVWHLWGAAFGC